jgi:CMP-N,N'-diacetyllegionaminic acid synthase
MSKRLRCLNAIMYKNQKIVNIIPARGGSKGVPRKNIKLLNGKPLISYAIKAAFGSRYLDRVIVSTDDDEIAKIAKRLGAEVPFIRPKKLARDNTLAFSVLQHAVNYLEEKENYHPGIVVLIQATSPLVLSMDIDNTIEQMIKSSKNSCFTACEISERPEWMYEIKKGQPILFLGDATFRTRRQDLPKLYRINGAVYVMTKEMLMKENRLINAHPNIFIMPRERSVDIDEPFDFKLAEILIRHSNRRKK